MKTDKTNNAPQPKKVHCATCRRFHRDTDGPSLNVATGEFFMGLCPKLHADGRIVYDPKGNPIGGRVFAEKPRICNDHDPADAKTPNTEKDNLVKQGYSL